MKFCQDITTQSGCEAHIQVYVLGGYACVGMRKNLNEWISPYQHEPGFEKEVFHRLYRLTPLTSLSVHKLGRVKEDEDRSSYIIIFICKSFKVCGLYPIKNMTSADGSQFLMCQKRSRPTVVDLSLRPRWQLT